MEDEENSSSLKKFSFNAIRLKLRSRLIYIRMMTICSLLFMIILSVLVGSFTGMSKQGAKAKEVVSAGTTLTYSRSGASMVMGEPIKYGSNLVIPIYSPSVTPLSTSDFKTKNVNASRSDGTPTTSSITLPSFDSGNGIQTPVDAKNYRLYISAVSGKLQPSLSARYVQFGATGLNAVVLSGALSDQPIRILLENKKSLSSPITSSPGLSIDGKVIDTKRDILMTVVNPSLAKNRGSKFDVSSSQDLLDAVYFNDYNRLLQNDISFANKMLISDQNKLNELKTNKHSLDAGDSSSSSSSSTDSAASSSDGDAAQVAIQSQQDIVNNDKTVVTNLKTTSENRDNYIKSVSSKMTVSTEYVLANK